MLSIRHFCGDSQLILKHGDWYYYYDDIEYKLIRSNEYGEIINYVYSDLVEMTIINNQLVTVEIGDINVVKVYDLDLNPIALESEITVPCYNESILNDKQIIILGYEVTVIENLSEITAHTIEWKDLDCGRIERDAQLPEFEKEYLLFYNSEYQVKRLDNYTLATKALCIINKSTGEYVVTKSKEEKIIVDFSDVTSDAASKFGNLRFSD